MNAHLDTLLILIMIGYGLLSGAGIFCLKIGMKQVKDFELTIKNAFRNPIYSLYKFLKVPVIFLGAILAVSGFLIYQFALLTYDITVVKPLTNLNLLFIFLFGFFLLKEKVSKRDAVSMVILIMGVILISVFVEDSSTAPNILIMIIFSCGLVITCIIFLMYANFKGNRKFGEYFLAISSGIFFSLGVLFNKAIYETGFSYDLASYLYNPFTYLLVISYMCGLFIEVIAFSQGRLVVVGTVMNIIGVGIPIIGGLFIFNESLFILFSGSIIFPLSYLKLIGIILIIVGTIAIYPKIEKIKGLPLDNTPI